MRWNFVNGILVGGIAAALLGMYCYPQMKITQDKSLMGRTRKYGRRTGRFVREAARDVRNWVTDY